MVSLRPRGGGSRLHQMGVETFRERGRVGGLNLNASRRSAFDEYARQAAALFAVHTSVVMGKVISLDTLTQAVQTRQRSAKQSGSSCTGTPSTSKLPSLI
jgi:hypothetical protein